MFSMHMELAGNLRQGNSSISDNIATMFIKWQSDMSPVWRPSTEQSTMWSLCQLWPGIQGS